MSEESDEYGFVAAARVGLEMFDHSQRGSGRTTRMIERATDRDLIITATEANARHLRDLLRRAGKNTRIFVVQGGRDPRNALSAPPTGRILYDHEWVKDFVRSAIGSAAHDLTRLQGETAPKAPVDHRAAYMIDLDRRTPRR